LEKRLNKDDFNKFEVDRYFVRFIFSNFFFSTDASKGLKTVFIKTIFNISAVDDGTKGCFLEMVGDERTTF
jgi:hypothetical protein